MRVLDPYFYSQGGRNDNAFRRLRRRLLASCGRRHRLVLGLAAWPCSSAPAASADSSSCADAVTSAPTGPATVSAETKAPFGKVLVVGSGDYDGCSLYLLTSDQLHSLTGSHYACSDNPTRSACRATPSSGRRSSPTALPSPGRGSTPPCSAR